MREELVKQWHQRFPYLGRNYANQRFKGDLKAGIAFPMSGTPRPTDLLEIMPDILGNRLLQSKMSIEALGSNPGFASRINGATIEISSLGVHDLFHEIGHYLWRNEFTKQQKDEYAQIVGASDAEKLSQRRELEKENSTEEHFARNVQNILMLRKLEIFKHQTGKTRELIDFMKKNMIIDEEHENYFDAKNGDYRAFIAAKPNEMVKADEKNPVFHEEAKEVLAFIRQHRR